MFNLNPEIDQFELSTRSFNPHLMGKFIDYFANFIENYQSCETPSPKKRNLFRLAGESKKLSPSSNPTPTYLQKFICSLFFRFIAFVQKDLSLDAPT